MASHKTIIGGDLVIGGRRLTLSKAVRAGDFVFLTPEGREVGRAADLRELERMLQTVPDESIVLHGVLAPHRIVNPGANIINGEFDKAAGVEGVGCVRLAHGREHRDVLVLLERGSGARELGQHGCGGLRRGHGAAEGAD